MLDQEQKVTRANALMGSAAAAAVVMVVDWVLGWVGSTTTAEWLKKELSHHDICANILTNARYISVLKRN